MPAQNFEPKLAGRLTWPMHSGTSLVLPVVVRGSGCGVTMHGLSQVLSAKIVAKSRTKQLRFGFITMATPKEAQRCIDELNGTELKGKKITVELVSAALGTLVGGGICIKMCD